MGLCAISSTCHAQQWIEFPADNSSSPSIKNPSKSTRQFPEEQVIKKELEVTTQWQTITFKKPLRINRKGLMGLHLAVDKRLYIPSIVDHPLNPKCNKPKCAANAFCLRRLSDGVLIRPDVVLIADNGVEIVVKSAGHLYPFFDRNVITMALRASNGAKSSPRFPEGIRTFNALRIRSTEPFVVRYLYWIVDRYPFSAK